jgi:hypothetical protein
MCVPLYFEFKCVSPHPVSRAFTPPTLIEISGICVGGEDIVPAICEVCLNRLIGRKRYGVRSFCLR